MAIAAISKVQIIAYREVKEELLSILQESSLIQLESISEKESWLNTPDFDLAHVEEEIYRISQALQILSQWEGGGGLGRLFSQKPRLKIEERKRILNFDYHSVLSKIEELEREKNELLAEIRFLEKEQEFLAPLERLEIPIKKLKPTESTEISLGWIPHSRTEDFEKRFEDEPFWYGIIGQEKRNVYLLIIFSTSEKNQIEQILKELNFNSIFFPESLLLMADEEDSVPKLREKIRKEIELRKRKFRDLEMKARENLVHREKLMLIHDVLLSEKEKLISSSFLGETEKVFLLEGWVRSSDIEKLKSKTEFFSDFLEMYFRDPLPEEEPPVILENPPALKPFEIVTKLYGLPQQGSLDPTLPLAPFFFLFVGLCVSEAGYGFLAALFSLLYIKRFKPRGGLLQFLRLLSILGVSTVIFGTLVGGWFGIPLRRLMVLDPLRDPLSFLLLSLILGFFQVWYGTFLSMVSKLKERDFFQAIFVQGGWLLLLPSLLLYGVKRHSLWGLLSIIGASAIIFFASPKRNPLARFFGGLYSLYDISRYLADILSYSRLLALGLATSVIAMVVNTLCRTALGIPWLGWLFAALIFLGGHLFNMAISFLGGFVHSMRLQFVEFFSKFFRAGGNPFKPFSLQGKYVEFV